MAKTTARQDWMGLLARVRPDALAALWDEDPPHEMLRPPEIGSVMVRGRMGGTGAAFNLGEMIVTRCSLKLADGAVGHGYVQGRDRDHARRAALIDALMQGPEATDLRRRVLDPLAEDLRRAAAVTADRAAKTKVEFFTMVRGED